MRHVLMLPAMLSFVLGAGAVGCGGSLPAQIALPGNQFFPESVAASSGDALIVGSIATGAIVRVDPTRGDVATIVPPNAIGTTGVLASDSDLWACGADLKTTPPTTSLRRFDIRSGALQQTFSFSQPAFCNDLAIASDGTLYVSDSFGKVWRLPPARGGLEIWKADALLAPSQPNGFGANGIALDGAGHLYVDTNADGRLLRIDVRSDGSAGALTAVTVTPKLTAPDGMRLRDGKRLVIAEHDGSLVQVSLSADGATGVATVLAADIAGATAVALIGHDAWVTSGQLEKLFGIDKTPVALPFVVRHVALP